MDSRLTLKEIVGEVLRLMCPAFNAGHVSHESELLPGCSDNDDTRTEKMEIGIKIQIEV